MHRDLAAKSGGYRPFSRENESTQRVVFRHRRKGEILAKVLRLLFKCDVFFLHESGPFGDVCGEDLAHFLGGAAAHVGARRTRGARARRASLPHLDSRFDRFNDMLWRSRGSEHAHPGVDFVARNAVLIDGAEVRIFFDRLRLVTASGLM